MIRYWMALMLMLVAACAAQVAPPPPPPPPPPPMMVEPPVMAVEVAPVMGGGAPPPIRNVTRSSPPPRSTARPAVARPTGIVPSAIVPPARGRPLSAAAIAAGAEKGLGAFITPKPMAVKVPGTLEFAVGADLETISAETQRLPMDAPQSILIARGMRVTLLDHPAFKTKPRSASEQDLGEDMTGTWLWEVTPLVGGKHELHAQVEIMPINPDGSFGRPLDTSKRRVEVTVTVDGVTRAFGVIDTASEAGEKLTGLFGTWQKTIAALIALLGAIGLLLWKLGLRKAKPAD